MAPMRTLDEIRRLPADAFGSTGDPKEDQATHASLIAAIERLVDYGLPEADAISIVLGDETYGQIDLFAIDAILGDPPWIPSHWLVRTSSGAANSVEPVMCLHDEDGLEHCLTARAWLGIDDEDWWVIDCPPCDVAKIEERVEAIVTPPQALDETVTEETK
ncbi:MAG: hypothetical protein C4321_00725 [Chloroflexota bacterium]